jgi:polyisoprenyl-teichoic acid--peptidoglycan teichoic acid transferase
MRHLILLCLLLIFVIPLAAQDDESPEQIPLNWDGQSRLTILILGMDRRVDDGDTLAVRTDVVIVASIDPVAQTIGLLHVPRDVHFAPPDTENFNRVNTLFQDGEAIQEGYGAYWIMDTLQYNLGIYIDRYVLFDFRAFMAVIDAMGGVTITTGYPIRDNTSPDLNYGYDPFYLPAGTHDLDGYQALQFVRTRHQDTDMERGERQLQLLQAIHTQMTETETFTRMLRQAPNLFTQLQGNIYTDLTVDDALLLTRYAILVPGERIKTGTMDARYLLLYPVEGNRRAYMPDRDVITELMIAVFGENYAE